MDTVTIHEQSDPSYTLSYTGTVLGSNSIASGNPQNWIVIQGAAGTMLFIDGQHQSTLEDEYIYHETFVHSLMWRLPSRKRVLLLGGAEGCLAREVLRWHDVEEVVQVDWDKSLVDFFRLPEQAAWNNGVYEDHRIKLVYQDAHVFLKQHMEPFDAIFVDLLDPSSADECAFLTTILKQCKSHLTVYGGLSCNIGPVVPSKRTFGTYVAETFQTEFVAPYFSRAITKVFVPSYLGEWCFCMATPHAYRCGHRVPPLPEGTRRNCKEYVHREPTWTSDYPLILQTLQCYTEEEHRAVFEKVTVCPPLHIHTDVTEYYGC
jgi:spermidine synthase